MMVVMLIWIDSSRPVKQRLNVCIYDEKSDLWTE